MSKDLLVSVFKKNTAKIIACFAVGTLTLGGCASVKLIPGNSQETATVQTVKHSTGHSERQALVTAVNDLERTPWPAVTETSVTERMVSVLFGRDKDKDGLSKDEAAEIYVDNLSAVNVYPVSALINDADNSLSAARRVAESGRMAADAINPNTDDIAVLEDGITEIRFQRDMYVNAMRKLKSRGFDVSSADINELSAAFSQTISDIGETADVVAERAMAASQASQLAASPDEDVQ